MDILNSKAFLIAVGVAGSIAVLAFLRTPVVTPLKPSAHLPTFQQVQDRISNEIPSPQPQSGKSEPWSASERYASEVRKDARKGALKALELAWSTYCEEEGHRRLLGGLGYYVEQRGMQQRGYAASWGKPGAQFIAEAWGTSDDERIEQMMQDVYARGYFKIDEFAAFKRETVVKLLGKAKPGNNPCSR
jgi:hypothetical protein